MTLFDWIYWPLFAVIALWATWLFYQALIGRRNDGRPRCPKCWYDMTGAPSLTCPECGHDARRPRNLLKRRRRVRLLVVSAFVGLLLWYGTQIRFRVRELGERPNLALLPTTFLIYRASMPTMPIEFNDALVGRMFYGNAAEPRVPSWQVWAQAWAIYQNVSSQPPSTLADRRMEVLDRLTYHSDAAKRRWAQIAMEQPVLRLSMIKDVYFTRKHLQVPAMREPLWQACWDGQIQAAYLANDRWAFTTAYIEALSNERLAREASTALTFPTELSAPYLVELLRRRPADTEKLLECFREDGRADRKVLLQSARSVLHGEPLPFEVRLTRTATVTNMVDIQVVPTDPRWLETDPQIFHDSSTGLWTIWLHLCVKANTGNSTDWQSVRQYPLYMKRYEPGRGWNYSVTVPKQCTTRAFLVASGYTPVIDGRPRDVLLLPVSPEVRMGSAE